MSETPLIYLDHVNLPARRPEWLAEWYAEQFGFRAEGGFVRAPGIVFVFQQGDPPDYQGRVHLGFRCRSRELVESWALKLEARLESEDRYCGFRAADPEGNLFEVYWEDS